MKAVVVELKNDLAAILSDDGCITTIKNNHYEIGQVIQINNPAIRNVRKASTFIAAAAACVFLSVGSWAYASPYSYVSMDVNPSIEFTVNRFDRVLKVHAVNEDGQDILDSISISKLKNKSITDALIKSVDEITEAGYFDSNIEGGIVIATSSKDTNKADQLAKELLQTVEQRTLENQDEVNVEAFSVAKESVEEAKALGVTPGKLNLVEKLQEVSGDPNSIDKEEWLNKPVKDILKATKDYAKSSQTSEDTYSEEAATSPTPTSALQDKNNKDKTKNSKEVKQESSDETTNSSDVNGKNVVENTNNTNKADNKASKDEKNQNKADSKETNVNNDKSNPTKKNITSKKNPSQNEINSSDNSSSTKDTATNNNNQNTSKKDNSSSNSNKSKDNETKKNNDNSSNGSKQKSNENTSSDQNSGKGNNTHSKK